jgi:DNA-directed RNA polymerase specialized sigma24 family protein
MSEKSAGFDELLVQLRAANALLARLLTTQLKLKQADLVLLLARAGVPSAEIARFLGTTTNTVQVTLSRNRKRADRSPLIKHEEESA